MDPFGLKLNKIKLQQILKDKKNILLGIILIKIK